MSQFSYWCARRSGTLGAVAALALHVAVTAQAAPTAAESSVGRIDFDVAGLPAGAVEIDLSQGMFRDLVGLGDAAIAGMAESMLQSTKDGQGTRLAAEQLEAVRQLLQIASGAVHEARVRVYRELDAQGGGPEAVAALFDEQLRAGRWDTAVQAREQNQSVRISLLREEGAIRGIFLVAGQGSELVLVNVVCEISPTNVKKLTGVATEISLENGLAPLIERKMRQLRPPVPPAPLGPPAPPRPPKPEQPEKAAA